MSASRLQQIEAEYPRHRFYRDRIASDLECEAIREYLRLKGVPERKILTMSPQGLNNAYGAGDRFIQRLISEDSDQMFRNRRPNNRRNSGALSIDLDFEDITPKKVEPPKTFGLPLALLEESVSGATPLPQPDDSPETPPEGLHTTQAVKNAVEAIIPPRLLQIRRDLATETASVINNAATKLAQTIPELALKAARKAIEELAPRKLQLDLSISGNVQQLDLGLQHSRFETLLRAVNARDHRGNHLNIWLTGPTGSGKTTAAENIAKALESTFKSYSKSNSGWTIKNEDGSEANLNGMSHDSPFGADSSLDADYKIVGFKDANGRFHWTTFLRIFAFGGIYVADEIDNWYPSALVAINAALANGWISTPIGLIHRHPDCCIIAAANTWGLGATNDYVGRTKLDAATINRFPTKIDWPIDEKLEMAVATNLGGKIGIEWCLTVQSARRAAKTQGLQVIFSPRNTFDGIALLNAGFETSEVLDINLFAGLSPEQRKSLEPKLRAAA